METHRRRIIWFCSTETIAKGPEAMRRLRDEIGLTTIMPESPVCHTSGFRASDALAALSGSSVRSTLKTAWF